MFLDLDGFKEINDELGHEIGDQVLKSVAASLRSCMRKSDTIARFGGDEFTVLLPRIKHEGDEITVAQKILSMVKQPLQLEGRTITVSASIGIAVYPRDGADQDVLLRTADAAMYKAKQGGGDNYKGETSQPGRVQTERRSDDGAGA
jgi:diguanylate cyclase (GGDEF)-like protein